MYIFCIARKVPYENFLLVQKAPQQDRKEWDQERDRPPRAEREWDADKEPDSPSIHWMPHVRIGAGIDDFLICLDADIRRRPTVGLNNPEDSEKRDDDNCVAYKGDPRWYPRETITVIEYRQNDERKKSHEDERDNYFLRPFFFMPWTGLQAPLKERFVVEREIDAERISRNGKYGQEYPALPVIPRTRSHEDKGNEEEEPEYALYNCLSI